MLHNCTQTKSEKSLVIALTKKTPTETELASVHTELRIAKRDNFRKLCEAVSSTPLATGLHKALMKWAMEIKLSIRQFDGTYINSLESRFKALLRTHFPNCNKYIQTHICTEKTDLRHFQNRKYVQCAFLEIHDFYNTYSTSVIQTLERRQVKAAISRWVDAVLRTGIVETSIGSSKVQLDTTMGCSQVGVLSPILY